MATFSTCRKNAKILETNLFLKNGSLRVVARVTGLGDSPFGPLFTLGRLTKITEVAQIFWQLFSKITEIAKILRLLFSKITEVAQTFWLLFRKLQK
jgi:hypothetical protein